MKFINLKFILLLFVLFGSLGSVFAFDVCNVSIDEPWFVVNDENSVEVLIVDEEGDLYVQGNSGKVFTSKSEVLIGAFSFGANTASFGNVNYDVNPVVGEDGVLVQNNAGLAVAYFNDSDIDILGRPVYQNSQGGCLPDGGYCNGDSVNLETRDYFCDLTGVQTGNCNMTVVGTEDCTTRLSNESDGGEDYLNYGEVYDYTGCTDLSLDGMTDCDYDVYKDECLSTTNLLEYFVDGIGVDNDTVNCNVEDYFYCSTTVSNRVNRVLHSCDITDDECQVSNPAKFIEDCTYAGASTYTSWSCTKQYPGKLARVRTDYSNACGGASGVTKGSSGLCKVIGTGVTETSSCTGTQYCSGGSCKTITYSWVTGSWGSCSKSCGGGTQSRTVYCKRNFDGAKVSDSYCGGGKPSVSQSCNTHGCSYSITYTRKRSTYDACKPCGGSTGDLNYVPGGKCSWYHSYSGTTSCKSGYYKSSGGMTKNQVIQVGSCSKSSPKPGIGLETFKYTCKAK